MHLGMVGLGRMGLNMARRLRMDNHHIVGFSLNKDEISQAASEGITGASTLKELAEKLPAPRLIWLMIPAGKPVDDTINQLKGMLQKGDIIIDGGNSYYKDAIRRSSELAPLGIRFMDMGVSGGIWGLKEGYCIMGGGPKEVSDLIAPVINSLVQKGGYYYCGPTGAGHYAKMVHNGIEYGMMEAYAEGFELLQASEYGSHIDFSALSSVWNRGSVIRSWLLELCEAAFSKDNDLSSVKGYVEDSGEGRWTVKEAVDSGVEIPAITAALFRRFGSRNPDAFAQKVLAIMRKEFGGHAVKKT